MRCDLDRNDRITATSWPLLALAPKADAGPILEAGRELEVDGLAVRQRDPLRLQSDRILEWNLESIGDVGALLCRPSALSEAAEWPATRAAPRGTPEQSLEQVAKVGAITAAAEVEVLETGARLRPARTRRIAAKAAAERHLGIAFLVDLTAIVLGALVLVRQQVVGRGHFPEALGGVRVVFVAVGVKLLGEAAIGLLDLRLARAALQAQALVEVECHIAPMPQSFIADQMGCGKREAKPKALARWRPTPSSYSTYGSPRRGRARSTIPRRWRWRPRMQRGSHRSGRCC